MAQSETQYQLFKKTWQQEFDTWKNTPAGAEICNRFIRIAWGIMKRGKKVGAKAIAERLRWYYMAKKQDDSAYKINNNMIAYMARHAMVKEPELDGFFNLRVLGAPEPKKVVILQTKKKEVHQCG